MPLIPVALPVSAQPGGSIALACLLDWRATTLMVHTWAGTGCTMLPRMPRQLRNLALP